MFTLHIMLQLNICRMMVCVVAFGSSFMWYFMWLEKKYAARINSGYATCDMRCAACNMLTAHKHTVQSIFMEYAYQSRTLAKSCLYILEYLRACLPRSISRGCRQLQLPPSNAQLHARRSVAATVAVVVRGKLSRRHGNNSRMDRIQSLVRVVRVVRVVSLVLLLLRLRRAGNRAQTSEHIRY